MQQVDVWHCDGCDWKGPVLVKVGGEDAGDQGGGGGRGEGVHKVQDKPAPPPHLKRNTRTIFFKDLRRKKISILVCYFPPAKLRNRNQTNLLTFSSCYSTTLNFNLAPTTDPKQLFLFEDCFDNITVSSTRHAFYSKKCSLPGKICLLIFLVLPPLCLHPRFPDFRGSCSYFSLFPPRGEEEEEEEEEQLSLSRLRQWGERREDG